MADDTPEDTMSPPDSDRAKRAPPTIDLEASEVSGETHNASAEAQPEPVSRAPHETIPPRAISSRAISPWVIAPVSGAVAAALVICIGWMLGWPAPAAPGAPNATAIDELSARVASVESKINKPAAPDPTAAGRAGLTPDMVATQVQAAMFGDVVTQVLQGDRQIGVRVRYPLAFRSDRSRLAALITACSEASRMLESIPTPHVRVPPAPVACT